MLGEWITHLSTPCPQPHRRMGYLKELIAIERRHRRCQLAWSPHLERCRNLIIKTVDSCSTTKQAVVLGSGLLLDVPLAHLAQNFDDVVLVDICHLHQTRKLVGKFQNVRSLERDISGITDLLNHWLSGPKNAPLPSPSIDYDMVAGADYVISSNLMAQLPLTPMAYLEQRAPGIESTVREDFARNIIDHHLSLLQSLDCPVTLITETLRLISSGEKTLNKVDPLFGAPLLYEGEEWWWDVAPRPEIDRNFDVRLAVRGIANLNDAGHARFCRNTTLAAP